MSSSSSECVGQSDPKKPCKGILKSSSSFDKPGSGFANYRKTAKFDEINVQKTYHPPDKDYGHMKVNEPKTPYAYSSEDDHSHDFDPDLLAEKLRIAADTQSSTYTYDENSDEDCVQTADNRAHLVEFERRRKAHYNEFKAVLLARKLIQVELENEESGVETADDAVSQTTEGSSSFEPDCNTPPIRVNLSTGRGTDAESMDVGAGVS